MFRRKLTTAELYAKHDKLMREAEECRDSDTRECIAIDIVDHSGKLATIKWYQIVKRARVNRAMVELSVEYRYHDFGAGYSEADLSEYLVQAYG